MRNLKSKSRVALYGRHSTSKQNAASSDDQIRAGERYAAQQGWTVVAKFTDAAVSGAFEHGRTGLQALKKQALLGAFDVVVVESVDRLGRNVSDVTGLCKRLKFHGIEIHTYTGGKQTELLIAFMSSLAESELEKIAERTKRGARSCILDRRSAGGRTYGYISAPRVTADGKVKK